jgi:hypothetical protein
MVRKVFYSFHFQRDSWRVSQVRGIGAIEENQAAKDNDWETIKKGGDAAIQRWIDGQLDGRSCTVLLIGPETAGRKWINYEIQKTWRDGKGILGIYIHNLKDATGNQTYKGSNPFNNFTLHNGQTNMGSVVKTYDPPFSDSKMVYAHIAANLGAWIEEAIRIRNAN